MAAVMMRCRRACAVHSRALCTAASSSELARWGSFGMRPEQVEEMVERVKQDGEHQARIMAQLAEMGIKLHAMVTQPLQWFGDAEWRKSWMEKMSEPVSQYTRVHDRLMDGCEHAYQAVAEEFCSAEPDFEAFVRTGALEPQLAAFLQTAATKHRPAGQRAVLDIARVNGQVLMLDSFTNAQYGFVATILFRSREQLSWIPVGADAAAASDADAAPAAVSSDSADADGAPADAASAPANASEAEDGGFRESAQVWTFTAERPAMTAYVAWLRAVLPGPEGGDGAAEQVDKPVMWKLRDINFVVKPYEAPDLPRDAQEMLSQVMLQISVGLAMCAALGLLVTNALAKRQAPPPALSPLPRDRREREPRGGGGGGGGAPEKVPVWSQDVQPEGHAASGGGATTM